MKELLRARIAQIHDPVQKILLQDVLADVFGELLKYTDSCFASLEEKIDGEFPDSGCSYDIYTGVCKKDGLDAASRCLSAVEPDAAEPVTERSGGYLGTMFLACGYPDVQRCLREHYQAKVETDQGSYQTAVRLIYSRSYAETFRWLYRQFGANQRQWHTLNCPFLYKMLDILDIEGAVPKDAAVLKTVIDMGEFSEFVQNHMVLVWNLSTEDYSTRAKLGAAGNISFYEHQIPLQDRAGGYLAVLQKEEPFTAVFSKNGLCIRTENEPLSSVRLLKVNRLDMHKDQTALQYPLQTNHRNLCHADRQASLQTRYLWTKGEVERMLHSYEVFQDFELVDICPDMQGNVEKIDMNPFIRTHALLKKKRKLALILHPKDKTDIFIYEKMFFLIAELQLCTEEYEWTGIIQE